MSEPSPPILKLRRYNLTVDPSDSVARVRALTGKGSARQALEILKFALSRQRLPASDYYHYGLWRPDLASRAKAEFVSDAGSRAINFRLSPIDRVSLSGFTTNKFLTGLALRSAGFPMQRPKALFGLGIRIPGTEALETAADIATWLRRDGNLPIFGKPLHKSLCVGVASYISLEDQGKTVLLGDGRAVNIDALAAEISENFASGYLFEPIIRQHPDVEAITGPAVGAIRVVTLRQPDGIRVLYVAQRLPAVGSMNDGASKDAPFAEAHIDRESGRIIRVQDMDRLAPDRLEASHVTGKPFSEVVLPFIPQAQTLACEAHRLLVGSGVLGFDIALSTDGPLINEVNSNPHHAVYQRSADRGLLNTDFGPQIKTAIAFARSAQR